MAEVKPDINKRDARGYTILHEALIAQDQERVKELLEQGADPDTVNEKVKSHDTSFSIVCDISDVCVARKMTDLLLEYGADPNLKDHCGHTPLHLAASAGKIGILKRLLKHGADVDKTDQYGYLPLRSVAISGYTPMCSLLVSYGAHDLAEKGIKASDVAREFGNIEAANAIEKGCKEYQEELMKKFAIMNRSMLLQNMFNPARTIKKIFKYLAPVQSDFIEEEELHSDVTSR